MDKKNIVILAGALIVGLLIGWFLWRVPVTPGGATGGMLIEQFLPGIRDNGGLATELPVNIGASGTDINAIIYGTCNLSGPTAGLSASSTGIYQCAVTGAASGDKVFVLPNSSPVLNKLGQNDIASFSTGRGVLIFGSAFASTTDVIGVEILNYGSASTSFAQATTGVQYLIFR